MKNFTNKLYRNHALIYKLLLLIGSTILIVYLFPKSGRFKYSFEKGKPWQSETLQAPFTFAIKKTDEEIAAEKKRIKDDAIYYFDRDSTAKSRVRDNFRNSFENLKIPDSLSRSVKNDLRNTGNRIINHLYEYGVLSESLSFPGDRAVIILDDKNETANTTYSRLVKQSDVASIIRDDVDRSHLEPFSNALTSLFFDIVEPNLVYNKTLTEQILNEALDNISYTRGIIEKETLIISKGEVVQGDRYQILKSLESEYESQVWTKSNYYWIILAYTVLVSVALLMLLLFLRKYRLDIFENNTKVTFIFFNIILMVVLTTLVVDYNSQFIYVVPIAILPLVLKAFFDARLGLFTHVITVLLIGSIVPNSYEYMFLQIIAGIVTILTVSELYKRANLFISVGQITLIYIIAYFAFFVIHEGSVDNLKWENFIWFILGGFATLFVQPLIYAYEKMFGLVSDVSLLELSDTNSKLLKELANTAPGTFHHSLNVANLCEACANEVGANTMLVRVGALYHDIGKMKHPPYFTENQSTGINPHDDLSPEESAKIIVNHVIDGIEIAKKYGLPDRVIDFIRTHHGTLKVYYFYIKAKEKNSEVKIEDFSYPGPKPFSKETAILMMCDSVEAASKSLKEPTSTKIDAFVENIINKQMEEDQFINANITFRDIQVIKKVLKSKLANIYHLRIEYPE